MAETEPQPFKKRKIYDAYLPDASQSETLAQVPPQSETLAHVPPQSETLAHVPQQTPPPAPLKQDDLAKKRRNRDEVRNIHGVYRRIQYCRDHNDPQLHQAYLSLIAASKGCTSVQRIAADLIPRYAPYCSSNIEAAVEALISMYGSSMDIIDKVEDDSGIAFDIAVACVVGLADICCIAPSQAMNGICASVFWTVLVFFLSSFGKQDLHQITDNPTVKMLDSPNYFRELKQKILDDVDKDNSQRLLMLRCVSLFRIFVCRPRDMLSACFDNMQVTDNERPHEKGLYFLRQVTTWSKANVSNHMETTSDDMELCTGSSQLPASSHSPQGTETTTGNNNDIGSVFHPSIESCLLEVVLAKDHSLRRWLISKCKMLRGSVQLEDVSAITSALEGLLQLTGEADKQEEGLRNCEDDISATSSSSRFNPHNRGDLSSDSRPEIHPLRNLNVLNENNEVSNKGLSSHASGPAVGPSYALASPSSGHGTCSDNQNSELFDGDSEAMDIFSASKLLWVGSLTADASEGYLRFQFERFGPIELVHIHTVNSYAIVGFKYIMDAIKARDYMRMNTPWDIRFSNGTGISPNSNVPVPAGSSPYVYIGIISSQWAKDEILHECRKVIHNGPCMITDLTREGALLLEFETPAEAAKIMTHLRRYRRERIPPLNSEITSNARSQLDGGRTMQGSGPGAVGNSVSGNVSITKAEFSHSYPQSHQQPVPPSPIDRRGITNQSQLGNNSPATFNLKSEGCQRELISPRLQPDNVRTLPQGGHAIQSQWPAFEGDRRALSGGYTEQMWMHTTPVNLSGVAAQGQCSQTQHFQAGQYMQPVFAPPDKFTGQLGNNSPAQFNLKSEGCQRELISPRLQPDNGRTLPQGGHAIQSQWPTSEADRRALSGGYTEQMWMHTAPVNLSGVAAQGHIPQTQHFQAGQYMQPVFAPPSSSWDPRGGNQSMNVNPLPPGIMLNHSHGVTAAPFVAASTSQLTQQETGNSIQGYHSVSSSLVVPPHLQDSPHPPHGMPPIPICSPLPDCTRPPPPLPLSSPKPQPQTSSASHMSNTGSAAPSTECHWQGTLSKSGVRFCTIQAKRTDSEMCQYTNIGSEPFEWPSKFNMTKRTDFQHVKSTFKSTQPHKREVCRLFPASTGDYKGFQDFISYLKQRNCVGVIKVPAGKSMWARLIFLLPYSLDICTFLSISPSPSDCLIALVLPKEPCIGGS